MFTARGISAVGAHHTGSVGVTGSNPVCSTKAEQRLIIQSLFCFKQSIDISEEQPLLPLKMRALIA